MKTKSDDLKPAFPKPHHYCNNCGTMQTLDEGMTLRDYFAAVALQGLLAQSPGSWFSSCRSTMEVGALEEKKCDGGGCAIVAKMAYGFAEAMIAERDK